MGYHHLEKNRKFLNGVTLIPVIILTNLFVHENKCMGFMQVLCGKFNSTHLLFRLKIMESVENVKWKLQWNRINFLAFLITVTVFAWVYHKGLPSSVKAIIGDRITHKPTATERSHRNRRNLDKCVLCSVMLGVTDVSWSGFGRPALLTHSIGSCACPVYECHV